MIEGPNSSMKLLYVLLLVLIRILGTCSTQYPN